MKMKMKVNIGLAVAAAGLLIAGWAPQPGGFQLTASLPGNAEIYKDAALVIATKNCAEPKNARVSARFVERVDGRSVAHELTLANVREGEYVVKREWAEGARGVVIVDGTYQKYTTGLIIGIDGEASFEGQGRWVSKLKNGYPTRLLDRHVADADVSAALSRLSD